MGSKISKCGSYRLRKKEKIKKIEKTERQASIISLPKAQIYEDILDDDNQNQVEVTVKEVPEPGSGQVQLNLEFSMQMEQEFDVHLKSITSEVIVQNKIHKNSENTVYHDISEDDSFYDAQSVDNKEDKEESVDNDNQLVEDLQNWSIVSLDSKNQEETNVIVFLDHSHSDLTTKGNEDTTCHNVELLAKESIENKEVAEEINQINNHSKTRESPTPESNFDFVYIDKNLDRIQHQEVSNQTLPKNFTTQQPITISSDTNLITPEDLQKEQIPDSANPMIQAVTKSSNNSDSESSKNIETSEEEIANFDTSRLVLDNPQEDNLSKLTIKDKDLTEENLVNTLLTPKDSSRDSVERKSSSSSTEKEKKFETANQNTQKRSQDQNSSDDEDNANKKTINELKAIIKSIDALEAKIDDTENQNNTQNTYQALIKIMMEVNQVKNEEFDEEILNLQNMALNQINHCLKILKK